tara:strand:+ start:2120 stop:3568 length:1449 start_codon:yes stop_codon:yes gene_type:complete
MVLISCPCKHVLKLYNTATRKVEDFHPIEKNKVGMYVCGLTVYNDMHLGHARTYIAFDVIRRWLEYLGYEVNFVQNHTDIDDKIIKKANEERISSKDLANKYIDRTTKDLESLQVRPPTHMPKATNFIPEMIEIISDLIEKDNAYVTEPAPGALAPDVYFDVLSASDNFGTLTGQKIDDMAAGARVAVDNRKRHPSDFVLWKGAKPDEPNWDSPWGLGRPGWHIECSAMSLSHLGKHFDIHGGGIDLRFPHHESEILQSECHTGTSPMSNYWLHSGHLTVNKEKMSKSLDNFFLVRDIMKEYSAPILRFYLLNGHYRSPIDFSDDNLKESMFAYRRLEGTYKRLVESEFKGSKEPSDLQEAIEKCRKDFALAMNDDFNTREGIAALFQLARISNNYDYSELEPTLKKSLASTFEIYGSQVLGLFSSESIDSDLETKIQHLILERDKARKAKNWAESDLIREKLKLMGIEIQDTPDGTKWRRI